MKFPELIDVHVHTAPDVRPRRFTDDELLAEILARGARGAVLKSHFAPTADRAWLLRKRAPGIEIHGSLTLNPQTGGISAASVAHAIESGAKIIWLPTLFSENHRRIQGKTGGEAVVRNKRVTSALADVIRLVAEADIVLASGHISAAEAMVVARAAWSAGVKKVMITHPEHMVVAMTVAQQCTLVREGPVTFERCYSHPDLKGVYHMNFEANLRAIETVGPDTTVLISDCGQIENPLWPETWEHIIRFYREHGIGDADLHHMMCVRPAQLLNLPTSTHDNNSPMVPLRMPAKTHSPAT